MGIVHCGQETMQMLHAHISDSHQESVQCESLQGMNPMKLHPPIKYQFFRSLRGTFLMLGKVEMGITITRPSCKSTWNLPRFGKPTDFICGFTSQYPSSLNISYDNNSNTKVQNFLESHNKFVKNLVLEGEKG